LLAATAKAGNHYMISCGDYHTLIALARSMLDHPGTEQPQAERAGARA
jgi:hypothetical protein